MDENTLQEHIAEVRLRALVGADQFIYYRQHMPTARVSPDVYVIPGFAREQEIGAWKTWETGVAPSFALEIVSDNGSAFSRPASLNPVSASDVTLQGTVAAGFTTPVTHLSLTFVSDTTRWAGTVYIDDARIEEAWSPPLDAHWLDSVLRYTLTGDSNRAGDGQMPSPWIAAHTVGCGEPTNAMNVQIGTVSSGAGRGSFY